MPTKTKHPTRKHILIKQMKYKGFYVYTHKAGALTYYTTPYLSGQFTKLATLKRELDKLDKTMSKMEGKTK